MLGPPKQKSFLTIPNEKFFPKTQGGKLGAKIAPNIGLEYALKTQSYYVNETQGYVYSTTKCLKTQSYYVNETQGYVYSTTKCLMRNLFSI